MFNNPFTSTTSDPSTPTWLERSEALFQPAYKWLCPTAFLPSQGPTSLADTSETTFGLEYVMRSLTPEKRARFLETFEQPHEQPSGPGAQRQPLHRFLLESSRLVSLPSRDMSLAEQWDDTVSSTRSAWTCVATRLLMVLERSTVAPIAWMLDGLEKLWHGLKKAGLRGWLTVLLGVVMLPIVLPLLLVAVVGTVLLLNLRDLGLALLDALAPLLNLLIFGCVAVFNACRAAVKHRPRWHLPSTDRAHHHLPTYRLPNTLPIKGLLEGGLNVLMVVLLLAASMLSMSLLMHTPSWLFTRLHNLGSLLPAWAGSSNLVFQLTGILVGWLAGTCMNVLMVSHAPRPPSMGREAVIMGVTMLAAPCLLMIPPDGLIVDLSHHTLMLLGLATLITVGLRQAMYKLKDWDNQPLTNWDAGSDVGRPRSTSAGESPPPPQPSHQVGCGGAAKTAHRSSVPSGADFR